MNGFFDKNFNRSVAKPLDILSCCQNLEICFGGSFSELRKREAIDAE